MDFYASRILCVSEKGEQLIKLRHGNLAIQDRKLPLLCDLLCKGNLKCLLRRKLGFLGIRLEVYFKV